jgi:hypothetical protein
MTIDVILPCPGLSYGVVLHSSLQACKLHVATPIPNCYTFHFPVNRAITTVTLPEGPVSARRIYARVCSATCYLFLLLLLACYRTDEDTFYRLIV